MLDQLYFRKSNSKIVPLSGAMCHLFDVSSYVTGVMCHVSGVTCQRSGVICQMSGVMCHKSFVRKGTHKATNHLLIRYHLLIARCHVWYVKCQVSTVGCPITDVTCQVSRVSCQGFCIPSQISEKNNRKSQHCPLDRCPARCHMSGVQCHMFLVTLHMSVIICQLPPVKYEKCENTKPPITCESPHKSLQVQIWGW